MAFARGKVIEWKNKAHHLLHDYPDRIPDEIVSGEMKYKVQKNWFFAVNLILSRIYLNMTRRRLENDQKFLDMYVEFQQEVIGPLKQRDATKDDIKKANKALKELIDYCNRFLKAN